MSHLRQNIFTLAFGAACVAAPALFAAELIMVDQKGCHYCEAWTSEIGPSYPKTAEGRFAPLVRRDIADGAPEGARYARRVNFTPTFILMEDGAELARIEGYPGEDFFWPVLTQLLSTHTDFDPESPEQEMSK